MPGMTWTDIGPWALSDLLLPLVIVAAAAYLCGCFNGAVIVSKYILRDDVRRHGSGNAGLTNFYRTFGGPLTLVVILLDVVKAVVAVWVGILVVRYWDERVVGRIVLHDLPVEHSAHDARQFYVALGHPFHAVLRGHDLTGGAQRPQRFKVHPLRPPSPRATL